MHEGQGDGTPERQELGGPFERADEPLGVVAAWLRIRLDGAIDSFETGEGLDIETGHLFSSTTFSYRII